MQNLLAVFSLHCLENFSTNIPCKQRGIKSLSTHNRCTQQKNHEGREIAQKTLNRPQKKPNILLKESLVIKVETVWLW